MWSQYLYRWVPTDTNARKFPIAEQPSLNPRACWVSSDINQSIFKLKVQYSCSQWNWYSNTNCDYFTWSRRMDLLSPTSAFRFPMPGGDGQSLQRHRSTSTPNVHMVSTVGPAGVSIIEVSVGCLVHVLIKQKPPELKNKTNMEVPKTWMAAWDWLQKQVNPHKKMAIFRADINMLTALVQFWSL